MEHRDTVIAETFSAEEYHIVICSVLQFLSYKLNQLVFNVAAVNAGRLHSGILIGLPYDIVNGVGEVRVVNPVQNRVND